MFTRVYAHIRMGKYRTFSRNIQEKFKKNTKLYENVYNRNTESTDDTDLSEPSALFMKVNAE